MVEPALDRPYVAISHVWAAGLGNASNNSLPVCQLRVLQELVDNLTGVKSQPFWIDTLGVQVSSSKESNDSTLQEWSRMSLELRGISLKLMVGVYQLADSVLVLDEEI